MTTPTIPGYTATELATLTPEELSALESDAGDNEDELKVIAGDDDTGTNAEDGKAAADGTQAADGTTAPVDEDADTAAEAPAYVAQAPADAPAQLDALKQAKEAAKTEDKAALKKLHDGEIDFDEYEAVKSKADAAIDEANDKIAELNKAISKAEIASEMSQQEAAKVWSAEVGSLMKTAKTEGLDYQGNAELNKELNGLVRAFGAEATERGMSDEGLKASKWALAQAHSLMKIRHADLVKVPAAGTKPAAAAAAGQPRHTLTTLNNMPNADRTVGDNDTLAKFGQLEGEDLERALAGMSKAEVEKLMASV